MTAPVVINSGGDTIMALLPTGSEEREVLGVRIIHAAILSSRQDIKTIASLLLIHAYRLVVKIRNAL